jgi:4-amino-4-deoxy-L-arabinose transferase-like glycosyltransferase
MSRTESSNSSQKKWIIQLTLAFVAALLIRGWVFVTVGKDERKFYTYDSSEYVILAQNLIQYGAFSQDTSPPLTPDTVRTPIYPLFIGAGLMLYGENFSIVILLQILLGSLSAVFTYFLAQKLELPAFAGLIAAWIVSLDPVSILLNNRLLTETLFAFLLISGAWSLAIFRRDNDTRILAIAAFLISLSALTRPIAQFLPIALLPLIIAMLKDRSPRVVVVNSFVFLCICGALMFSWGYRNYRLSGQFSLSTISDINLIYYRARAVLAEAENISQDEAKEKLITEIETIAREKNLSRPEISALERKRALQIFSQYPVETVVMLVKGAGRLLIDPGYTIICTMLDTTSVNYECFPGESTMLDAGILDKVMGKFTAMNFAQRFALIWGGVLIGAIYLGLVFGAMHLISKKDWFALSLLLILIAYFVLLSAGGEANYRFRAPIQPYLAILAGIGYEAIFRRILKRREYTA